MRWRALPTHSFTFAPERNEPAVVYVVVGAGGSAFGPPDRHSYRWTMQLRYSLGGRVYSRVIDDDGHPFELVAYQPTPPPAG